MFNIDFDYEDFFVKRLQQLRDQKNISAREMSVSLGQNINYINQIENKKNFPTMQSFFYICQYLNITPEEFFCIDKVNPEKSDELSKMIGKLNTEQLDILEKIIYQFFQANKK